jgi:hypothetical protein
VAGPRRHPKPKKKGVGDAFSFAGREVATETINRRWGRVRLVEPDDRTLEAFERCAEGWLLLGMLDGDTEVRLPPFDVVGFPLMALWPEDEQVAEDQQRDG